MEEDKTLDIQHEEDVEETETPAESSTETKPAETTTEASPVDEKADEKPAVPFHEDPKIQEYINRQVENRIRDIVPPIPKKEEAIEVPAWWGGDEAGYKSYLDEIDRLIDTKATAKLEAFKSEQMGEQTRIREAQEYMESTFSQLGITDDNLRNRVLKKVEDEKLVTTDGKWNWSAGYKLVLAEDALNTTKPNTEEKKRIAAASTTKDTTPEAEKSYITTDDIAKGRKSRFFN